MNVQNAMTSQLESLEKRKKYKMVIQFFLNKSWILIKMNPKSLKISLKTKNLYEIITTSVGNRTFISVRMDTDPRWLLNKTYIIIL